MRKAFFLLLIFFIVGCTGQERNYIPGAALADDLETLSFSIKDGYRNQHPRLLFSEDDKSELLTKKEKAPEVWRLVTESADIYLKNLRDAEGIKRGRRYYETASYNKWYCNGFLKYYKIWCYCLDSNLLNGSARLNYSWYWT